MSQRLLQGGGNRILQGGTDNRLLQGSGVINPPLLPAGGASGGENDNALKGWWGDLGDRRRRLRPARCRTSARLPALLVTVLPDDAAPELAPLPAPEPARIALAPGRVVSRPSAAVVSCAASVALEAGRVSWWGTWRAELRGRLAAEEEQFLLAGWPE